MASLGDRLKHAWNAFQDDDQIRTTPYSPDFGMSFSSPPERRRVSFANERATLSTIFNKIAVDVSAIKVQHVILDELGMYKRTIHDGLNYCISEEANLDQSARDFFRDCVISMCDHGVIAVVPVETTLNPNRSGAYDITQLRVGKIVQWYPQHVKVDLYDERTGKRREIVVHKKYTAIIENPFYDIMNEPNSTLKRLVNKLSLLDTADQRNGSGKLDLIIQLPYVVKTDKRQEQAEKRRKAIEMQLKTSSLGIAYTDGTEKITQLNRPVENGLIQQTNDLQDKLYNEMGLSKAVFDGSATEEVMNNYYNRTIEPIISAITDGMNRKFLTKTARTQGHKIMYFRDPFKLVTVTNLAEIADKFTRNEIMTSNEIRSVMGLQAVNDPGADELRNKNIPIDKTSSALPVGDTESEV